MRVDQVTGQLTVGQLASQAGVRPDTIRYYEREGLLPLPQRTGGEALAEDKGALVATIWCAAGSSAGYVLGGPVAAEAGLIAAAVVGAVFVMLSVMLGGRAPRSPVVRLMLIICVITRHRPGDYLVPASGCRSSSPGRPGAAIRKHAQRPSARSSARIRLR